MREWVLENGAALRSEAIILKTGLASSTSPLPRTIEGLMESFATAGLGLELKGRVQDLSPLSHRLNFDVSVFAPCAIAWHTDRGSVALRVTYDEAKSMRVAAHVLKIAWWIGDEHHDGWWHCYPKFPRDWIKGIGRH
jgi:hypothetical protein